MKKNLKIYQINSYKALTKKNYTKYIYRGRTYGKAKLVLQVLKDLLDGSYWDFDEFKSVFKKTIQGSFGVFITFENFKEKYRGR